jgi:acyl carrier protein
MRMTTQEQVFEYIRTKLNPNAQLTFDPGQNLMADGILDSLAMMDLIVWLEQTFNITIDTEDLVPENFGTLNAMANYVGKARAAA